MEKLLPKWLMKRYLVLLDDFKTDDFDFNQAEKKLDKIGDDKRMVGLFLSDLRKAGWLDVEFDKKDARRRVYRLKDYKVIFNNFVKRIKSETNR
jgi:hypothetical protein